VIGDTRVVEPLPSEARRSMRAALDAIERRDPSAARAAMDDAGTSGTTRARLLFLMRDYQAALDALCPDDPVHLRMRFALERRLHFDQEAFETLRVLRERASPTDVRLFATAASFLMSIGEPEAAIEAHDAHFRALALAKRRPSANEHHWRARCGVHAGNARVVESSAQAGHAADPSEWLKQARCLRDIGSYDALRAMLKEHAGDPDADAMLAELSLYAMDLEPARALAARALSRAPENRTAKLVRAAVAVLGSSMDPALEADLAPPEGSVAQAVWRARLSMDRGRRDDARRDLAPALGATPGSFAARLYAALLGAEPDVARWSHEGLLEGQLAVFGVELAERDGAVDGEAFRAAVREVLTSLGGNYTSYPSRRVGSGIERVVVPPSPRDRAIRAQHSIRVHGVEHSREALDRVIDALGLHPIARCYRAELALWLGRPEDARAELEAILARDERIRWAWVGLAGAAIALGDPRAALDILSRGGAKTGPGPSHAIYECEALHALGERERAIAAARRACESPTRASAWIFRCLLADELGLRDEALVCFAHLETFAGALLSDAARAIGIAPWWPCELADEHRRAVARSALGLMRGNRSSACAFWMAPKVRSLVHVPIAPEEWAKGEIAALRRELG
jgi:tetratricopeptide (TPR) repeat protein